LIAGHVGLAIRSLPEDQPEPWSAQRVVRSPGVRLYHRGMSAASSPDRYLEPGWFTRNVFNRLVSGLTTAGLGVWGSRTLAVRGRTSGEWRSTPVNLLTIDDRRYLVAPRGETQWVRNLRAAESGELRVGKRVQPFTSVEIPDDAKPAILRAYLHRWKFEVGAFFDGVSAASSEDDLARIAPHHPVFELTLQGSA
jgi:deazaflavin-dependent oxidoreductase (nitroreductase family)